ncbi:MAG: DUF6318 family protein [Schaalia odontolytica]|nr:DUF6318 family protein [Schaalia odontolytica]MDU5762171.1 DUF6318 family protein [Schaalia odontolytica]
MKVPPLSERPVNEEEEQAFLAPPSRRKKRSIADTRAALRPWVIGIGLTVLVAVACVVAYRLAAGIASWNEKPSAAATPTVHPVPAPTVFSEPAMSGGYEIGPDGVLVRPAEFAADTYTKPELPEVAKENTERGAEAAAEHYLALLVYAWNTGDTQPLADMSDPNSAFANTYVTNIGDLYKGGWSYGTSSKITDVLRVEPVPPNGTDIPDNSVLVKFHIVSIDGIKCQGVRTKDQTPEYGSTLSLILTWNDGKWVEVQGRVLRDE